MTRLRAASARLAFRIASLAGWRRCCAAALFGACAAAAQPPFHVLPALVAGFAGLIWLLDGAATARRSFGDGWMFGAGYFAAGLYWVSNALLVDAERFVWLIPFAAVGLSFGLGAFGGMAALAFHRFRATGLMRVCVLAACWTFFEWARGAAFTGFPWNPVGNVWVAAPPVLQAAAWFGVYGLSFVTAYAAGAFALLASPGSRFSVASGVCLLAALAVAGGIRLATASDEAVDGVKLRIVQPNIAQRDKWRNDRRAANLRKLLELSVGGGATHVIWPEAAVRFALTTDGGSRRLLSAAVPRDGILVTGFTRYGFDSGRLKEVWNSLAVLDDGARIVGVYDKHRLVPFGEFVPFRSFLPMDKITPGALDFSPGPGPATLRPAGSPPFSPLICYEAIFPGGVTAQDDRPAWLLNVTNDAWFGGSAGPYQHFASARMRAVEEGLPLVRTANTGISGVVDAYGRVRERLDLEEEGVVDANLPRAAARRTPYSLFGDLPAAIAAAALLLVVRLCERRNARRQKNLPWSNDWTAFQGGSICVMYGRSVTN